MQVFDSAIRNQKKDNFVKGPLNRIDLDVRRVWECPTCHKQRKADGEIVTKRCFCTKEGVWMQLVESRRQVRTFPRPVEAPTSPPEPTDEVTTESNAESESATEATTDENAAVETSNDENPKAELTKDE